MKKTKTKNGINRKAIIVIEIGLLILLVAVIGQLFNLQVVKHAEYAEKAISQQTLDTIIEPKRGSILDSDGNELAISAKAYMVTMAPNQFNKKLIDDDYKSYAENISRILDLEYETVYSMTQRDSKYIVVARRVEESVISKLREYMSTSEYKSKYGGTISIADDVKRYYPHNNLLSTVIGFVGSDNQGLEGIEMAYDEYLRGTPGKIIAIQNNPGTTSIPFEYESIIDATDGCDITLTIKLELQYMLEKYIEETRVRHNVENRVAGIIYDIKTGEIYAMSSKPDYDPNNPFLISDSITLDFLSANYEYGSTEYWGAYNSKAKEYWKNKLCEQYEPGSTFKILTLAMTLEEGLGTLEEKIFCGGFLEVATVKIHCNNRSGHGMETIKEGLANSCNPVFMTLALRIGPQKFYDYLTLFGLRDKTNSGVAGEQTGYHHTIASLTNQINLAESGFGQSFKITPLQLVAAVCSIANDGYYMKPYIIKQITDSNGNIVVSNSPEIVKQTVSKQTSDIICEYLEYAVEYGRMAYAEGYRIAGKTGTSEKLDTLNPLGESDKKIASFIGFAPADDPRICVLVVVDEPNSDVVYGSVIAAPLAKKILVETLEYFGIEPDFDGDGTTYQKVPYLSNKTLAEAKDDALIDGFVIKVFGDSSDEAMVTSQLPYYDTSIPLGSTLYLFTDDTETSRYTQVPDLTGKTAAECNRLLLQSNLNIKIIGENINFPGVVCTSQSVAPGEKVQLGTVISVNLEAGQ